VSSLPGVTDQKGHLLCGDLLGGNDQIAFVLAVLVINSNDELASGYERGGKKDKGREQG